MIQIARCSGNQHKSASRTSLLLRILSLPVIPVYNWHSFKRIYYSPTTNRILFSLFVETNTVFYEFRLDDVIISLVSFSEEKEWCEGVKCRDEEEEKGRRAERLELVLVHPNWHSQSQCKGRNGDWLMMERPLRHYHTLEGNEGYQNKIGTFNYLVFNLSIMFWSRTVIDEQPRVQCIIDSTEKPRCCCIKYLTDCLMNSFHPYLFYNYHFLQRCPHAAL